MAKIQDKGIVPRGDDFQETLKLKGKVNSFLRETLEETTEKAFEASGYPMAEKPAGEYGDGRKYGLGAEEEHFNVKIGGQTQSLIEKQISIGAKRMIVEVQVDFKDKAKKVEIRYRTTEWGAFRGYGSETGPMMVNETMIFDLEKFDKFKKDLKKKLEEFAKKEVAYMTNTKLGVEDRTEKSTASMVESKRMSIKDIFFSTDDEFLAKLNELNEEVGSHTDIEDKEEDDLLLSTNVNEDEEDAQNMDIYISTRLNLGNNYTLDHLMNEIANLPEEELESIEEKVDNAVYNSEVTLHYQTKYGEGSETFVAFEFGELLDAAKSRINEITSAGGAGSAGGFRYDAPFGKINKREMMGNKKFENTEYAKKLRLKEESGHWSPMIQESKDGFWTVVSQSTLDAYKKNHIMGAPGSEGVEVNSENEEEFNSGGVQKFPQGKSYKKKKKVNEAWEWSHTNEAYDNVRENIHNLPHETLVEIMHEWDVYEHFGKDPSVEDFKKVPKKENLPSDVLADAIFEKASELRLTDNGGFNFWISPWGDHTVSADIENEPMDEHKVATEKDKKSSFHDKKEISIDESTQVYTDPSISKRWKPENKLSQEQLNERWKRLSTMVDYETIREAESVTPDKPMLNESKSVTKEEGNAWIIDEEFQRNQNIDAGDEVNDKKLVSVKKDGSITEVSYLVKEMDYNNSRKAYIFDFKTGTLVKNPNYKA